MVVGTDCCFAIPPHPAYAPDLAPLDFCLFPELKTKLRGRSFGSNEGVMEAVIVCFVDQNREFYLKGLYKLEHRWAKCMMQTVIILKVRP
jgi:hypothetical protein